MSRDDKSGPSQEDIQTDFTTLVRSVRVGVLITMSGDRPLGSHVPFLIGDNWTQMFIHISQLASHTKNLAHDRRIALFLAEPDRPEKNPMALKRINLQGEAQPLPPTSKDYETIKQQYLECFPQSAMTFQLPDFQLWSLLMTSAHFVAGFGRAFHAQCDTPGVWLHQGR